MEEEFIELMIPLFREFGSISNSGALWQLLQPTPPAIRFPFKSKTGLPRNNVFPRFYWVLKLGKFTFSLETIALPLSYLESKVYILLIK